MDMFYKDMEVNYFGQVRVTKALLPLLRKYIALKGPTAPSPRLVNMTSTAGIYKISPVGSYCASKHAAETFSVTLRAELKSQGIFVSIIEPYYARTPLITAIDKRKIERVVNETSDEVIAAYGGEESIRKKMARSAFNTPLFLVELNWCNMVVGYVCVGTNDLPKAKAFYDELLSLVNAKVVLDTGRGYYYTNGKGADFLVTKAFESDRPAHPGNGPMVSFEVESRKAVHEFFDKAIALGSSDAGPVGLRGPEGPEAFYAGYFKDPEGNKLCVYKNGPADQ
ncbi:hypothetical protein HDU93_004311 [Gonapodya sp. JEL0774]|nr:hypothetical protein HDU93_004311 [Gonapodya sp. JEL0774]